MFSSADNIIFLQKQIIYQGIKNIRSSGENLVYLLVYELECTCWWAVIKWMRLLCLEWVVIREILCGSVSLATYLGCVLLWWRLWTMRSGKQFRDWRDLRSNITKLCSCSNVPRAKRHCSKMSFINFADVLQSFENEIKPRFQSIVAFEKKNLYYIY